MRARSPSAPVLTPFSPPGRRLSPAGALLAGNAHFKAKAFLKAAGCYTKATKKDPSNPVYQSNLAAALIGLSKFDKAALAAQVRRRRPPTHTHTPPRGSWE